MVLGSYVKSGSMLVTKKIAVVCLFVVALSFSDDSIIEREILNFTNSYLILTLRASIPDEEKKLT